MRFFSNTTLENQVCRPKSGINLYPFGAPMGGSRSFQSSTGYRYGFNGKLKVDEISGDGNSVDFGDREYDTRLGRWWSVDPLAHKYPNLSPYNFALNNPIYFVDKDGNIVVDMYGNPVTVIVKNGGTAQASASFEFSKGTSEKAIAEFYANGGKVIQTLITTPTGNDIVQDVKNSPNKIHTNVVTKEEKPDATRGKEGLILGQTSIKEVNVIGENGLPTGEKQEIVKVNIYEVSIKEAGENARNSQMIQDPNSPAQEFEANNLTDEQKNAATAAHEFKHATSSKDLEIIKKNGSLPAKDPQHKESYNKGTKVANELGNLNKKQ